MTGARIVMALWAMSVTLLGIAGLGAWRSVHAGGDGAPAAAPDTPRTARRPAFDAEDPKYVTDHDPFRLARHPASVPYRPELEGVSPPPPAPKPPHPTLALGGILGGPPWEALLDGVPGHDGSMVVKQGQVIGELRIRAVTHDSVIVQGADTTWRLGIRRSWQ